jgi:hypothetical protein
MSNPHPALNLSTGRKLPRMAGGPMASQDYYEAQTWKSHLGLPSVLSWCVRNAKVLLSAGSHTKMINKRYLRVIAMNGFGI